MTENNFDVLNSAMETVEDVESLLVNPSSEETLLNTDYSADGMLPLTDDEIVEAHNVKQISYCYSMFHKCNRQADLFRDTIRECYIESF